MPIQIINIKEMRIKLTAGTNVGCVRTNNEDNFITNIDLSRPDWFLPKDVSEAINLCDEGCVFVVADGMGGLNAGEVASAIAVEHVKQEFLDANLKKIAKSEKDIQKFLQEIVVKADAAIKKKVEKDPETKGMGTTLIFAWVIGQKAYISWCGDSRAYLFNPNSGLKRISKDHSYVQELVDAGKLDADLAFDHPNSNIITRCLGDFKDKAKPDFTVVTLKKGDRILLCSDGLCGICRDEEIIETMNSFCDDIENCKKELINAALNAGGYDNVTIALMEVVDDNNDADIANTCEISRKKSKKSRTRKKNKRKIKFSWIKFFLIIILLAIISYVMMKPELLEQTCNTIVNKLF